MCHTITQIIFWFGPVRFIKRNKLILTNEAYTPEDWWECYTLLHMLNLNGDYVYNWFYILYLFIISLSLTSWKRKKYNMYYICFACFFYGVMSIRVWMTLYFNWYVSFHKMRREALKNVKYVVVILRLIYCDWVTMSWCR